MERIGWRPLLLFTPDLLNLPGQRCDSTIEITLFRPAGRNLSEGQRKRRTEKGGEA
jgi:hypothetical protein